MGTDKDNPIEELRQFLSEAPEFVCVSGRQFHRFAQGNYRLRFMPVGVQFESGPFRCRLSGSNWMRSTHRFIVRERNGGTTAIILKPSRRNELWLQRQRFRWYCEEQAGRRWKVVRSGFAPSAKGSGACLRMILRRRGCWFVAVAAGEEEEVRAESVLSQLLILCRQFELSRGRRVNGGLLFVPTELAETVARLLRDMAFPTEIYCLPGWVHFRLPQTLAYPLLWPAESVRAELAALQAEFDFPNEVQLVHRDGRECAFEYLGLPFAVYESDKGVWKFPLRERESGKGGSNLLQSVSTMGGSAKVIVREEFQRIRGMRRPHARFRSDSLYQLYAERWLESLIVRNPKYLDPDLRSSPVYSQVPAYITRRRVIDLVAVTESGRLVVIEVKVQKSPDLLLQGLAYWRIVQQAQQQRAFQHNGYFRDVELSEEAPLLYCVTPLLALHAEQRHFAKWLRPEIPAYLIGINNDWRRGVKVLRKEKL